MHPRARICEQIRGPVPAIGRLERNLRCRTPRRDLAGQDQRIVLDPDLAQHRPPGIGAHDHRPAAMQIDTHILLRHSGPPSPRVSKQPEHCPGHSQGAEAPLLHRIRGPERRVRGRVLFGLVTNGTDYAGPGAGERVLVYLPPARWGVGVAEKVLSPCRLLP